MSEINANIVVQPYAIDITMQSPTLEVVAEPINLNLALGGFAIPGGNNGQLQYNNGGILGGIPYANYLSGNLSLGNVANLKILGGNNQYFLQTDGTGNLTWQAGTGNATGNGTVGGANTQIQFNDSANFGGAAGFTFDKVSNAFNSPGDGTFVGNVTANNFIGNITANVSQIVNGNSNVVVNANANITISSNGVSNVVVITDDTIIGNIIEVNDIVLNNTAISLGNNAGTGASAIVIGNNAAPNGLNTAAIAIGSGAGGNGFIQIASIAIGSGALNEGSGAFNIAIGSDAGRNTPAEDTVAIGINAGWGAGNNAVAIGTRAGAAANGANQPAYSLILNASGSNLQANASNTFYVKPIRNASAGNVLYYDNTTGEISFNVPTGNLGNATFTGTTTVQQIKEKFVPNANSLTGNLDYNLLDGAIVVFTANATGNFNVNFRGNSTESLNNVMSNNESMTCTLVIRNGATGYKANSITIDGNAVSTVWAGNTGNAGNGTVNGRDVYTFNILKGTGTNNYTILSGKVGFI